MLCPVFGDKEWQIDTERVVDTQASWPWHGLRNRMVHTNPSAAVGARNLATARVTDLQWRSMQIDTLDTPGVTRPLDHCRTCITVARQSITALPATRLGTSRSLVRHSSLLQWINVENVRYTDKMLLFLGCRLQCLDIFFIGVQQNSYPRWIMQFYSPNLLWKTPQWGTAVMKFRAPPLVPLFCHALFIFSDFPFSAFRIF
jgi:hypothetical protein